MGYSKVEDEIHSVLTEITMLGFGLILIAHSKEKASGYKDKDGNVINQVRPDLSNQAYRACNAICDLIGYLGMDFDPKTGAATRWLYTRESPTRYAGSRWQFLEEKIPFGYNELVAAINMALEKDKEVNGTVIVDKVEHQIQRGRPFGEVIEELKNLCMEYANGGSSDEENEFRGKALAAEMRKVFKKDIKLSLITPEQIDLAEELIANIKELAGK